MARPRLTLHRRLNEIAVVVFFAIAACAAAVALALPQAPRTFLIDAKLRDGIMQAADMPSLRSAALSVVDETNRSLTSAGLALNAAFDVAHYALWVAALFALLSGAMAVYTLARMDRDTTT